MNILSLKVMKALEKQLDKAGGKFITGNKLTLADYVLCSQMQVEFTYLYLYTNYVL